MATDDKSLVEVQGKEESMRKIETLEDAARYAYGVAETRKEIEKIKAVAAAEIEKWQEKITEVLKWEEEVLTPLQDKLTYMETLLTDYHIRQYNEAPNDKAKAKLKSIKLPYGVTLASRELGVKLEVTDNDALLNYALENGLVDTPAPKPKWGEIKKQLSVHDDGRVFDSNGEEVKFVAAVQQERKFEVK